MRFLSKFRIALALVSTSAAVVVSAQEQRSVFGPQGTTSQPPPGIVKGMVTPSTNGLPQTASTQQLDTPDPVATTDEVTIRPGRDMEDPVKGKIKLPNITVSDIQKNGYIVEMPVPTRLPIIAGDPDSAWWESNPRIAFQKAQRQQRPLMLLFTSLTNVKCQKLSEEVFATRTFNDYVKENLVICYLSYPRNITDAPMSMRRVKEQFKVNGYPNILIFDPEGNVTHEITGYRTGRPVDYFNKMKATLLPELTKIDDHKKILRGYGFRDWKNSEGRIVFGKFIRRDDTLLTMLGPHHETWTVKIDDLSEQDQAYAETFPAIDEILAGQQ